LPSPLSLVPTAPSPGSGTHRDIHGPVTSPDPEGHTIASNRTRLLAATATALVLAGVGAQAASASSAHYESHTYQVRTHRVIDVECNYGETYLNFTTTADPAKSQVVETG